jgi:YafQ family addiction module toxin component
MKIYTIEYSEIFKKDFKKIRSDHILQKRFQNKINEIVQNPFRYKSLRNVLKNLRRVHIGNFVLIFEVSEDERKIILHSLKHHDRAYK